MVLPKPTPALRGRLLELVAYLVRFRVPCGLLFKKVRRDVGIADMPER